jgi:IS30 family transposase
MCSSATRTPPGSAGSSENIDGLLRRYFPKGTDFSGVIEAALDAVARGLNDRPRKRLGFYRPTEKIADPTVASTTINQGDTA